MSIYGHNDIQCLPHCPVVSSEAEAFDESIDEVSSSSQRGRQERISLWRASKLGCRRRYSIPPNVYGIDT
jgi:hypothetical protein